MEDAGPGSQPEMLPANFIRADEVDQTGADISTATPSFDGISGQVYNNEPARESLPLQRSISIKPPLSRDGSVPPPPPPPQQPPPPAPMSRQDFDGPPDSLSLMQLRRIVTDVPKIDPTAYAFNYADAQPFAEEIEEWFQYTQQDRCLVLNGRTAFETEWSRFVQNLAEPPAEQKWTSVDEAMRQDFVLGILEKCKSNDLLERGQCLAALAYILMGAWGETAIRDSESPPENKAIEQSKTYSSQLEWMDIGASIVNDCSGVPALFDALNKFNGKDQDPETLDSSQEEESRSSSGKYAWIQEADYILTSLYILVEIGRQRLKTHNDASLRNAFASLKPGILVFLVNILTNYRWGEYEELNLTRVLLLFWKCLLLLFGGSEELLHTKVMLKVVRDPPDDDDAHPFLTASPLDYHLFRQEIISKYPAYSPPPLIVPLEEENNSILPPLPNHPSRNFFSNGLFLGNINNTDRGSSIVDQPVHIATPAPSPPPSPIGPGGKSVKKQNYQTNNNFPFLYPPLDESSNKIGGKGAVGLQDAIIAKKWEGSDVPTSIMEAGTLFASRVRMTRSMRQLWNERELFMKHERGYSIRPPDEEPKEPRAREDKDEIDDVDTQRKLRAVEEFYRNSMPDLQSLVVVLLKVVLNNVSTIISQSNQGLLNGLPTLVSHVPIPDYSHLLDSPKPTSNYNLATQLNNGPGVDGRSPANDVKSSDLEELNITRVSEISAKAISAALLLLLKWFKISHILKYEYLTQLLVDSNYLPLILKLFAHQDVDRAIYLEIDQEPLGFFQVCRELASQDLEHDYNGDSEDDEMPPPIPRYRNQQTTNDKAARVAEQVIPASESNEPPEVDELGNPITYLPSEPITKFSWRNLFSNINWLRIMQKITHGKAHRCLLLVQYKSSIILRRVLKIPQPDLRLYILKLFKSQVPYCGRKWRQSNMQVITAIYLHCRPELRDDWLAGSDVDAEVEEALPLEQALRALTHWWHLRVYPERMGKETCVLEEERDFFAKELEGMGWGSFGNHEEVAYGALEPASRANGDVVMQENSWWS